MTAWLRNFLDPNYIGPPGDGVFGPRHLVWIAGTLLLAVALYQYYRRHPELAARFLRIVCPLLFMVRLSKQIYRAAVGIEYPAIQALPWHLCTLLAFVMPVVVFYNLKKLKPWVYPLCWIGGTVTLFLGTYFTTAMLKPTDLEGMSAHMLLIFVPAVEMAIGEFVLDIRGAWRTAVGLIGCTLWALIADLVLFPQYHTNSSQLMENNLGFDIPGIPFQALIVLIAVVVIVAMHGVPTAYRRVMSKRGTAVHDSVHL